MLSHEKVAITLTAYTASKNTQTQSTSEASDERYILLRRILRHRGVTCTCVRHCATSSHM
jgi:hypothetical protein